MWGGGGRGGGGTAGGCLDSGGQCWAGGRASGTLTNAGGNTKGCQLSERPAASVCTSAAAHPPDIHGGVGWGRGHRPPPPPATYLCHRRASPLPPSTRTPLSWRACWHTTRCCSPSGEPCLSGARRGVGCRAWRPGPPGEHWLGGGEVAVRRPSEMRMLPSRLCINAPGACSYADLARSGTAGMQLPTALPGSTLRPTPVNATSVGGECAGGVGVGRKEGGLGWGRAPCDHACLSGTGSLVGVDSPPSRPAAFFPGGCSCAWRAPTTLPAWCAPTCCCARQVGGHVWWGVGLAGADGWLWAAGTRRNKAGSTAQCTAVTAPAPRRTSTCAVRMHAVTAPLNSPPPPPPPANLQSCTS